MATARISLRRSHVATKGSKVSGKGWVVIPQELRERYGIKKGDTVEIVDYGGVLAIVPVPEDVIHESCGMFSGGRSLTEMLLESRREDAERGK